MSSKKFITFFLQIPFEQQKNQRREDLFHLLLRSKAWYPEGYGKCMCLLHIREI